MIGGRAANVLVEEVKDLVRGKRFLMVKLLANIPPFQFRGGFPQNFKNLNSN